MRLAKMMVDHGDLKAGDLAQVVGSSGELTLYLQAFDKAKPQKPFIARKKEHCTVLPFRQTCRAIKHIDGELDVGTPVIELGRKDGTATVLAFRLDPPLHVETTCDNLEDINEAIALGIHQPCAV